MNGESQVQPRLGAFAGEPVRTEFDRTPSLGGWRPPARAETGDPDYGVDAPGLVARCFAIAAIGVTVATVASRIRFVRALSWVPGVAAVGAASLGASLLAYAKRGKLTHRDRVLDLITWNGHERVLDIGTGRGLLMIGAAKRLTTGTAIGIDTWRAEDLSGNNRENTMRNAYLEGVVDKVEVRFEDARKLEFGRDSFDAIFSTRTLHNIADAADRVKACKEIARVLKPGGTAIVSDSTNVGDYRKTFEEAGLRTKELNAGWNAGTYTYLRTIVATKPAGVDGAASSK